MKKKIIDNVVWNKLYKSELFKTIRFPVGRVFEDIATTYRILNSAQSIVIIRKYLIHYRLRNNSLSRLHSIESLTGYWKSYYEKYICLSPILTDVNCDIDLIGNCITAASRFYRWYYGCSKEDRENSLYVLNEIHQFILEHYIEVMHEKGFSKKQRLACLIIKIKSPIIMKMLFYATRAYRYCFVRTNQYW